MNTGQDLVYTVYTTFVRLPLTVDVFVCAEDVTCLHHSLWLCIFLGPRPNESFPWLTRKESRALPSATVPGICVYLGGAHPLNPSHSRFCHCACLDAGLLCSGTQTQVHYQSKGRPNLNRKAVFLYTVKPQYQHNV